MKGKILDRFIHEDIEYIVGTKTYNIKSYKIDYPYVMITTKSSKKKRNIKPSTKIDAHYLRIQVKTAITLVRKIIKIFKEKFYDTDFFVIEAHSDDKHKRELLYEKILDKIGFRKIKELKHFTIYVNKKIKIKNKFINEYFNYEFDF